jgi:hypothetical protein
MAKKQRRQVSTGQGVQAVQESPLTARKVAQVFEFKPDYAEVKKDLKRIGILAGSFFVVLVALSFFLR